MTLLLLLKLDCNEKIELLQIIMKVMVNASKENCYFCYILLVSKENYRKNRTKYYFSCFSVGGFLEPDCKTGLVLKLRCKLKLNNKT